MSTVHSLLAAVQQKPAGGAAVRDIVLLGGAMNLVIAVWVLMVFRYRSGGARWLRATGAFAERVTGLPGWAAVPGIATIVSVLITLWGATWDIGLHIDIGRDNGLRLRETHGRDGLAQGDEQGNTDDGCQRKPQARARGPPQRIPPVPHALQPRAGGRQRGTALLAQCLGDQWRNVLGRLRPEAGASLSQQRVGGGHR